MTLTHRSIPGSSSSSFASSSNTTNIHTATNTTQTTNSTSSIDTITSTSTTPTSDAGDACCPSNNTHKHYQHHRKQRQRRPRPRPRTSSNTAGFPIPILELLVFVVCLTILILTAVLILCTTFLDHVHHNPGGKWQSLSEKLPLLLSNTKSYGGTTSSPGGGGGGSGRLGGLGASLSPGSNAASGFTKKSRQELLDELQELDDAIKYNRPSGLKWVDPNMLPSMKDRDHNNNKNNNNKEEDSTNDHHHNVLQPRETRPKSIYNPHGVYFRVSRLVNFGGDSTTTTTTTAGVIKKNSLGQPQAQMAWQEEWKTLQQDQGSTTPTTLTVDYTNPNLYTYPERHGSNSHALQLQPLKDLLQQWPQDDLDHPPSSPTIQETLQHFDYRTELNAAHEYQQQYQVPFKLTNVPDLINANELWTDKYLTEAFYSSSSSHADNHHNHNHGKCQESPTHFFTYFAPNVWDVERMGLPPTRNNDWDFEIWSEHARYADAVRLQQDQPHFYYQASVYPEDLLKPSVEEQNSFLARDLPIFSTTTTTTNNKNMFVVPSQQKGMQCRFGERGITTAAHFDAGKNMVAMITGAKRYILSPPNQCSKLGIVTGHGQSLYRHSVLNYGHFEHLMKNGNENSNGMPDLERQWLERAGNAMAVETVLKAGEILYIPSHWFHYIVSLQKSAQCNIRNGVDVEGTVEFGGQADVQPEAC